MSAVSSSVKRDLKTRWKFSRTLLKVSLEDLVQADLIFTTLMGEDVESRRKFIEENALDVRNLDV